MTSTLSSKTTKKLLLGYILENIDYRKRCLYVQDIIYLGKINDVWRRALVVFFNTPLNSTSFKVFSEN